MDNEQSVRAVLTGPQVKAVCLERVFLGRIDRSWTGAVRLLVRPLLRLRAREEYGARALADADQVNCAIGAHPGRDDPPPSWHGHQVLWAALIAYEADWAGGVASRGARSADAEYDDGDGDREIDQGGNEVLERRVPGVHMQAGHGGEEAVAQLAGEDLGGGLVPEVDRGGPGECGEVR